MELVPPLLPPVVVNKEGLDVYNQHMKQGFYMPSIKEYSLKIYNDEIQELWSLRTKDLVHMHRGSMQVLC
jgi:hypothetical protein